MALENIPIWSFRPNWSDGVLESLEWLTEVMASPTNAEQRVALRLSPRRFFEITVNPWKEDRQYFSNMLNRFVGSLWYVPLWHDVELVTAEISAGSTEITMDTMYREFTGSDPLIFLGQSAREFEAIEVQSVTVSSVKLKSPTTRAWPAGTRLYSGRKAFISQENVSGLNYMSDQVVQGSVQFQVYQPNPNQGNPAGWGYLWGYNWGGSGPSGQPWYVQSGWGKAWGHNWGGKSFLSYPTYRGYAVLSQRPNVASRLTSGFQARIQTNDNNVGLPDRRDTAGRNFSIQQYQWLLHRRKAHAEFRSLLYFLKGQLIPIWLPTFYDDFHPVSGIEDGDSFIDVVNGGFVMAGGVRPGHDTIMIERHLDLAPIFRRLVSATQLNATTERLFFYGPVTPAVPFEDIRRISFMELSRLGQDRIEITHHTDAQGASSCAAVFQAAPEIRRATLAN